jgi:uncharacterized membrane protein YbhN (UPF0104 family)
MEMGIDVRLRHLALPFAAAAALLVLALSPGLLRPRLAAAFEELASANAPWLWLAALLFAVGLAGAAAAWRSALARCGGETTLGDACARYCVGSGVNALAPARLGTAVRFALFAQVLPGRARLWTTGGVAASVGAARSLWTALLIAFAAASGVVPWWPVAVLACVAAAAVAVGVAARGRTPSNRLAHALDAFRALGHSPRAAAALVGWMGVATAARVGAAAGIAAAFGVTNPLAAGLLVIPALDLAGLLPLTPGNVGVASAAVAFALGAHGAGADVALAAGIAFSAVETLTSIACGIGGLLVLAGTASGARRWTAAAAGTTACLGLGVAFGATVLAPLV